MKRQKKCSEMSTELSRKILDLVEQGYAVTEIVKMLGVSRQYVYAVRKKNNLNASTRGRKSDIDEDLLRKLHSKGFSDAVIAKSIGVSRSKVVKARQKLGLTSNYRIGERGPGKLRDNILYIDEVRRILRDPLTARIIFKAARIYRELGGDEKAAWAATLIEPAQVYHPDPGSYCTPAEKTNLTHVKYAVQLETRQDFAGLCGLPAIQLVEKALECRGLEPSEIESFAYSLAEMVAYSGYLGAHITTEQARASNPDSVHTWNHIWDQRMEESIKWAPVKKESSKKAFSYHDTKISNGKKGKGGSYQNIRARQAYLGAAGY